jgi:ssDNA-binding Zn-finger/Zn-ribbon topoisomerase 1
MKIECNFCHKKSEAKSLIEGWTKQNYQKCLGSIKKSYQVKSDEPKELTIIAMLEDYGVECPDCGRRFIKLKISPGSKVFNLWRYYRRIWGEELSNFPFPKIL